MDVCHKNYCVVFVIVCSLIQTTSYNAVDEQLLLDILVAHLAREAMNNTKSQQQQLVQSITAADLLGALLPSSTPQLRLLLEQQQQQDNNNNNNNTDAKESVFSRGRGLRILDADLQLVRHCLYLVEKFNLIIFSVMFINKYTNRHC